MNEITLLNRFIIDELNRNPLVNTISVVPTIETDCSKENIYPLVNVDMLDIDPQGDAILVNYTVTIVQQRDTKSIKTDSKLLNDSNYFDNINECNSIAMKFVNYLRLNNNEQNIELTELSTSRVLKNWNKGGVDGVQFDMELSIYNRGVSTPFEQ